MSGPETCFLDIGNSRMTLAVKSLGESAEQADHNLPSDEAHQINNERWIPLISVETEDLDEFLTRLHHILKLTPSLKQIIAASVRHSVAQELSKRSPFTIDWIRRDELQEYTRAYDTPDTLGIDRILTALGAWAQTMRDSIIIDAGTACTIDAVRADKTFLGGVIMPGLHTLHRSLRISAPDLPETPLRMPSGFPGKSTTECLQWGLNGLFVDGVAAHVQRFQGILGEATVLITGGDSKLLHTWLTRPAADKPTYPGTYDLKLTHPILSPWLIFDGMNFLRS